MQKLYCVYMMSNRWRGTIYTGRSENLPVRVGQHKSRPVEGFTDKYNLVRLVWYEAHENAEAAAHREKCIKEWKRDWKIRLIEEKNPEWRDLFEEICK